MALQILHAEIIQTQALRKREEAITIQELRIQLQTDYDACHAKYVQENFVPLQQQVSTRLTLRITLRQPKE